MPPVFNSPGDSRDQPDPRGLVHDVETSELIGEFISYGERRGFKPSDWREVPVCRAISQAMNRASDLFATTPGLEGVNREHLPSVQPDFPAHLISDDGDKAMLLVLGRSESDPYVSVAPAAAVGLPDPFQRNGLHLIMPRRENFASATGTIISVAADGDQPPEISVILSAEALCEANKRVGELSEFIEGKRRTDPRSIVLQVPIPSVILSLILHEIHKHEPEMLGIRGLSAPNPRLVFDVSVVSLSKSAIAGLNVIAGIRESHHRVGIIQDRYGVIEAVWHDSDSRGEEF